jgi:nitrite reductase/ring-hydroxylating ferredoxin subunit
VRRRALCRVDEVIEGRGRGFRFGDGRGETALFLVRKDGRLYAYFNDCPHVGAPLDWVPGVFFDATGNFLFCSLHGAMFRPHDGYCVSGPCIGKRLAKAPIRVEDGTIVLVEDEAPPR